MKPFYLTSHENVFLPMQIPLFSHCLTFCGSLPKFFLKASVSFFGPIADTVSGMYSTRSVPFSHAPCKYRRSCTSTLWRFSGLSIFFYFCFYLLCHLFSICHNVYAFQIKGDLYSIRGLYFLYLWSVVDIEILYILQVY